MFPKSAVFCGSVLKTFSTWIKVFLFFYLQDSKGLLYVLVNLSVKAQSRITGNSIFLNIVDVKAKLNRGESVGRIIVMTPLILTLILILMFGKLTYSFFMIFVLISMSYPNSTLFYYLCI